MRQVLLRASEDLYQRIVGHLIERQGDIESFAFAFAKKLQHPNGNEEFACVDVMLVSPDHVEHDSQYHSVISDAILSDVFKRAHDLNASIVEFHTHLDPFPAEFSDTDWEGIEDTAKHALWRLRGNPYIAVVVTSAEFDGVIWRTDRDEPAQLDAISIDGRLLEPTGLSLRRRLGHRFDRNIRFFAHEGQQRLLQLSVAVVGVGGLGTHVVQQLSLLGVGKLILVDPDKVDETSLNRHVGIRADDPATGLSKVELGFRTATDANRGITIVQIPESLRTEAAFEAIRDCNYVIGCLDNEGARLILNELCLAYNKPYIDLATDISDDGKQYGGRVCVVRDGNGCLMCTGNMDVPEAQRDLAGESQAKDVRKIYGVDQQALSRVGPSVVSINGVIASLGVTEFMLMATELRQSPKRVLKYHGERGIVTESKDDLTAGCHYCMNIRGKRNEAGVERYIKEATRASHHLEESDV